MKLQQMPKLSELTVEVLIHCVKPLLQLLLSLGAYWVVGRVVVNVGKTDVLGIRMALYRSQPQGKVEHEGE